MNNNYSVSEATLGLIKQLSDELKDYKGFTRTETDSYINLDVGDGKAELFGVYKDSDVAICRNFAKAGTKFPEHYHDEWECFIVWKGSMILNINGSSVELKEKEVYSFDGKNLHSATFTEDCWFLAITIPSSEGFPKHSYKDMNNVELENLYKSVG